MKQMEIDVLVVGGGPAGLSAALVLGRCHRRVWVCDGARQRNLRSHAIHCLLGQEGVPPVAFLNHARDCLNRFTSVVLRSTRIADVTPQDGAFEFECTDGARGKASKVLLATGIVDELPKIVGIEPLYGVSVHHCLYCDGFEYAGRAVAAFGEGDKAAELALMMKHWTADVVACSNGSPVGTRALQRLEQHCIPLRQEPIHRLEGLNGQLATIVFKGGEPLPRDGLFFATNSHPASDLSDRLGCKRSEKGSLVIDPATQETTIPGVYAAGDVSRDVLLVAVAIAEGAEAAIAINKALLRRDGLCD